MNTYLWLAVGVAVWFVVALLLAVAFGKASANGDRIAGRSGWDPDWRWPER